MAMVAKLPVKDVKSASTVVWRATKAYISGIVPAVLPYVHVSIPTVRAEAMESKFAQARKRPGVRACVPFCSEILLEEAECEGSILRALLLQLSCWLSIPVCGCQLWALLIVLECLTPGVFAWSCAALWLQGCPSSGKHWLQ